MSFKYWIPWRKTIKKLKREYERRETRWIRQIYYSSNKLINWSYYIHNYISSLQTVVRPSDLKIKYPTGATLDSHFITWGWRYPFNLSGDLFLSRAYSFPLVMPTSKLITRRLWSFLHWVFMTTPLYSTLPNIKLWIFA